MYFAAALLAFTTQGTVGMAIMQTVADLCLLFACVWFTLRMKGLIPRFLQTVTALTGTGALLGLVAWPVIIWVGQQTPESGFGIANLIFLALFGWSLAVMTHIIREALEVKRAAAMLMVIAYLVWRGYKRRQREEAELQAP